MQGTGRAREPDHARVRFRRRISALQVNSVRSTDVLAGQRRCHGQCTLKVDSPLRSAERPAARFVLGVQGLRYRIRRQAYNATVIVLAAFTSQRAARRGSSHIGRLRCLPGTPIPGRAAISAKMARIVDADLSYRSASPTRSPALLSCLHKQTKLDNTNRNLEFNSGVPVPVPVRWRLRKSNSKQQMHRQSSLQCAHTSAENLPSSISCVHGTRVILFLILESGRGVKPAPQMTFGSFTARCFEYVQRWAVVTTASARPLPSFRARYSCKKTVP